MKKTASSKSRRTWGGVCATLGMILVVVYGSLSGGCESTNPFTQLQEIVFPDSGVSYQRHVQPVFNLSCAYGGCHDDGARSGGLSLTSWSNTNADPGNVVPFRPDDSKLVQTLERRLLHVQPLDTIANHIRGIRQWVLEGGKLN